MNKQLTKKSIGIAASAALMASLAFSGNVLAGPPAHAGGPDKGDRDPSEKVCDNMVLDTACSTYDREIEKDGELVIVKGGFDATYDLIDAMLIAGEFTSRNNAVRDADTLKCKTSGAEIKMYQGEVKYIEASELMQQSIEKVHSLYGQGKLTYSGLMSLEDAFAETKSCIDSKLP